MVAGLAAATPAAADVAVSDRPYVRHDGGTDAATAACSTNDRQQNEPAATVAPHDPALMSSGANDYCASSLFGTWASFAYSSDGGATWTNSLLPGYPTDDTAEGQASPLHQLGLSNAGDPVQAWDGAGHLYYAGIAFNRSRPAKGSIWVARYDWAAGPQPDYRRTALAARGTPSPIFVGLFHDKVQLEVDRGADSAHAGNVYVCWARFTASGPNNAVFLARSTDGGRTFSQTKVSESVHGSQFCDIAVTRDGTVFVGWRQYEAKQQRDGVAWAKSTDGGATFTKPRIAATFTPFDPGDRTVDPQANGAARHEACSAADGTLGGCAGPEPRAFARDCGDGPFRCETGYVFHRMNTQVRLTADPTALGDPDQVFVAFDASVPGSAVPTGSTYGTTASGTGTQASVFLVRTSDGGASWTEPARIDPQPAGHQVFPDVAADSGRLHAVWQDSRDDPATGPDGGDFRTVPVANRAVAANPPGSVSTGRGYDTYHAVSGDGGASWTTARTSTATTMPQYEQFAGRDVPFFGDYNSIAASGAVALMTWTDHRDVVAGTDPRYPDGDGTDGFDVLQCRAQQPDGFFGPDSCPNGGGLDQNVYGAVVGGP